MARLLHFVLLLSLVPAVGCGDEHSKKKRKAESGSPADDPSAGQGYTGEDGSALKEGDPVVDVDTAVGTSPARYLVEKEWIKGPVRGEGNRLKLVIGDLDGHAPDGDLALALKVVMKCCGSVAEQRHLEVVPKGNAYTFVLKSIDLPMAGTWKLDVSIKQSGQSASPAHLRFEETVR